MKHPMAIKTCNLDMENLITDSNRSIATLAITTLLKVGARCFPPHMFFIFIFQPTSRHPNRRAARPAWTG